MKELFDIHVVLATSEDMDIFDDEHAEEAAEQLNTILHMLYDKADEDTSVEKLENMVQHIWDNWREDSNLLSIDLQDLSDWVDQLLATWDDAHI